jgi:hypothetical protein
VPRPSIIEGRGFSFSAGKNAAPLIFAVAAKSKTSDGETGTLKSNSTREARVFSSLLLVDRVTILLNA